MPRGLTAESVLGLLLLPSLVLESGCASRAVPTHGRTERPAAHETQDASPGQLAAPPHFGPGPPKLDRFAEFEHRSDSIAAPIADPEATRAVLATTNVRVTQTDFGSEAETAIAVDPNNPLHVVAGAITAPTGLGASYNRHYSSLDGGHTWTDSSVGGALGFEGAGDPAVAYCGDGTVYFASLVLHYDPVNARSGVIVDWSTDGGLTWPEENRSTVVSRTSDPGSIVDKPAIICDTTSSAFANRIYVEYAEPASSTGYHTVKIRRSVDHGATWSAAVVVPDSSTGHNAGTLAIGPLGELYAAWIAAIGDPSNAFILFDKSTNGGVSFGTDVVAVQDYFGIDPDPNFRIPDYPIMDADRSNGPYRGNIYIAWSDKPHGDLDILLVRSTDGGTTWSAPIRVNDDSVGNGAGQFFPGLAVDPVGRVVVTWTDRRRYIGTEKYEVWGAISRDGGRTFDKNFLIGDTPSDVPTATFLGDYNAVAATSERLYPTWADRRPGLANPADIYSDAFPNTFRYDEVKKIVWTGASQLSFDTQDARFGVDLDYDVAGGLLSELQADHGFGRAGCTAPAWPGPPFVDGRVPPQDDGYYYLVRAHGPVGVGSYGDASVARPDLRDPLNQTLLTCP